MSVRIALRSDSDAIEKLRRSADSVPFVSTRPNYGDDDVGIWVDETKRFLARRNDKLKPTSFGCVKVEGDDLLGYILCANSPEGVLTVWDLRLAPKYLELGFEVELIKAMTDIAAQYQIQEIDVPVYESATSIRSVLSDLDFDLRTVTYRKMISPLG